ncbi:hypothetical protein KR018_007342, partial [Drosophila ironensis]
FQLNIRDCLGCDDATVNFSQNESVHVIITNDNDTDHPEHIAVTPVSQAILLLCTSTYPDAESLENLPQLELGKGMITLNVVFTPIVVATTDFEESSDSELDIKPSTSKQAREQEETRKRRKKQRRADADASRSQRATHVSLMRRFDVHKLLDKVFYQINGLEMQMITLFECQTMFFVRQVYSYECLRKVHAECAGNWLQVIQRDRYKYYNYSDPENPFETFLKLVDRKLMEPQHMICKLAKTCIEVNEFAQLRERQFVLDVFKHVGYIFEYITLNEYTIWFLIPGVNMDDPMTRVTLDNFDLTNVRTVIRDRNKKDIFWNETHHNIKDLVMVSFQLALASSVNQSILVLSHLEKLSQFSTLQYVTASFMNDVYKPHDLSKKWISTRYLQRIVEIADFLNAVVLIEYPSSLTLLRGGRQLIKCYPHGRNGVAKWDVFEAVVEENETDLQHLKNSFNV